MAKDNYQASIIIPTSGKRLDYLNDTLISVQNQDMPGSEYEIIVVDNGKGEEVIKMVEIISIKIPLLLSSVFGKIRWGCIMPVMPEPIQLRERS